MSGEPDDFDYLADPTGPVVYVDPQSGPPGAVQPTVLAAPPPARRGRLTVAGGAIIAVASLLVAGAAGIVAYGQFSRAPTAAERSAAAALAQVDRWRFWPAGRIFPATLRYSTRLLTNETATRVGISPDVPCAASVDPDLAALVARDHCQAGLRATYVDQLQGVVYTIGVLAFPTRGDAARFAAAVRARGARGARAATVRAFAIPGTASARFNNAARQAGTARQAGPFVVLTAAGYADGRPAAATGERRRSAFAPAAQLAARVAKPLAAPAIVNCNNPEFSC